MSDVIDTYEAEINALHVKHVRLRNTVIKAIELLPPQQSFMCGLRQAVELDMGRIEPTTRDGVELRAVIVPVSDTDGEVRAYLDSQRGYHADVRMAEFQGKKGIFVSWQK